MRPDPDEAALELDALLEPVVAPVLLVEAATPPVLDAVTSPPPLPPPPLVPPVNEKACPHPATTTVARTRGLRYAARLEGFWCFIEGGAPA
jgi:hypothetical protein